jgi:ATP-dependent DNA ligase
MLSPFTVRSWTARSFTWMPMESHRRSPQQFIAFDILWFNGRDLRKTPLMERKRVLRKIVPVCSTILYADHIGGAGREFYRAICDMDLEGIVAKWKDGLYTPEATTSVKIKNLNYSQGEGRRDLFQRRVAVA